MTDKEKLKELGTRIRELMARSAQREEHYLQQMEAAAEQRKKLQARIAALNLRVEELTLELKKIKESNEKK